jgi:hypothetical protein
MNVEMVARNIQIILAPVVLVTACAILAQGLLGRYAAITDRLRALTAERLALLYPSHPSRLLERNKPPLLSEVSRSPELAKGNGDGSMEDKLRKERLAQIDDQLPILMSHHKRSHDAVLAVYCAVGIFVADMFTIAIVAIYEVAWIATVVLLLFLTGTAVLLVGVLTAALEIRTSHQALHYEVMRVKGLPIQDATPAGNVEEAASHIQVSGC